MKINLAAHGRNQECFPAADEKHFLNCTSEHNVQKQSHPLKELFHITGSALNCLQKVSTVEEITNDLHFQSSANS